MGIVEARASLRQRVRDWALRRQGTDAPPFSLTSRRVYILPTAAGWTFAALVAVTFVAGMNYGNGLALVFSFWLASFALVAMVRSQRGLVGARILGIEASPGFAGGHVTIRLLLATERLETGDLRLEPGDNMVASDLDATYPVRGASLELQMRVRRRGRWRMPALRLSSVAPFGLFHTWTWLNIDAGTLVYPRPDGALPVPETDGQDGGDLHSRHGQDELAWLREFREGDSPRQVAWKAYARGAPLLVRDYSGSAARSRDFDFDSLTALDVEARLSQLTRWIMDAQARGDSWVLHLPGAAPLAGTGAEHRAQSLAQLALYGLRPEERA